MPRDGRTIVDELGAGQVRPLVAVSGAKRELVLLTPAQCQFGTPRPYIIKGLLARGDHAQFLGQPGSGKSALAPYVGYCIAQGAPVFGRRVRQGPVLYLACEDGAGMKLRVRALRQRLGDAPGFLLGPDSLNLMDPNSGDIERVSAMIRLHKPLVVFIDTVARGFPGLRENESDSMGRVVQVARQLSCEECSPAIFTVHHLAKNDTATTPRGHGVLAGDLDVILLIQGEKAEQRTVSLTKNRNGTSDCTFAFHIEAEDFGEDEDGDLVTAPIAAPVEGALIPSRKGQAEAKLTDKPKLMLRELRDLIDRDGVIISVSKDGPMVRGVSRFELRNRLIDRAWFAENLLCTNPGGKVELDRKAYTPENNALSKLKTEGFASFNRNHVWLL